MNKFKGRHLGFIGLLCVGWAAARVVIVGMEGGPADQLPPTNAGRTVATAAVTVEPITERIAAGPTCCFHAALRHHSRKTATRPSARRASYLPIAPAVVRGFFRPAISGSASDISSFEPTAISEPIVEPAPRRSLRADTYAYSFWRGGDARSGLAAGGQYGGGQSGIIATFSLQRADDPGQPQTLALLVRTSVAHDNLREREMALGVRWRPIANVPVTISAERRFRPDRADALAIYAAGGVNNVDLPLKLRAESFAQAGLVSGKQAGPFFDVFVRADRKVADIQGVQFHAGAGAWAGGQRDAARLDIGPSLRTDFPVRGARVRVNFDWRFRVAGDATPGNGPALTLSTGF